jgi:hypothetical protein
MHVKVLKIQKYSHMVEYRFNVVILSLDML